LPLDGSSPTQTGSQTWGYGIGARIVLGFLAAFMYGVVILLFCIPVLAGGTDPTGNAIIYVTGTIMAGFALFLTFGLIAIARTRITLQMRAGGAVLDAIVPGGHNLLLVPRLRAVRLPVAEIRSVERRQEVVRSFGLSSLRDALSVVTTTGERIGLFSTAASSLINLPLPAVADAIAAAAGVAVTDDGTVVTKASGLYGEASSSWTEKPLDAPAANKARRVAAVTLQIVVGLMMLTFIIRACT
jgi:hypothetical protein